MSLLTRAKEVTGGLANTSKRQAQRGKLELEIRRLEGKVGTEKAAIGDVLFPLLDAGTLTAPAADDHVANIRELLAEIEAKRNEIDELRAGNDDADGDADDAGTSLAEDAAAAASEIAGETTTSND